MQPKCERKNFGHMGMFCTKKPILNYQLPSCLSEFPTSHTCHDPSQNTMLTMFWNNFFSWLFAIDRWKANLCNSQQCHDPHNLLTSSLRFKLTVRLFFHLHPTSHWPSKNNISLAKQMPMQKNCMQWCLVAVMLFVLLSLSFFFFLLLFLFLLSLFFLPSSFSFPGSPRGYCISQKIS